MSQQARPQTWAERCAARLEILQRRLEAARPEAWSEARQRRLAEVFQTLIWDLEMAAEDPAEMEGIAAAHEGESEWETVQGGRFLRRRGER